MEEMKSHDTNMDGRPKTEIEVKIEIKDELYSAMDGVNSDDTAPADIQPTALPEQYELQRPEQSSQFYQVILPVTGDVHLPSRCRLCAIPDHDTVDIFNPDETEKNILEKIEYCLPIVVKETDALPKRACRLCLTHLELCYQFHKTVAEAERQLLACNRQTFAQLEEAERSFQTFQLCDVQREPTEYDDIEGSLGAISGIETSKNESMTFSEGAQTTDTTVITDVESVDLKPCSVVLFVSETHDANDLVAESKGRSPSDTKYQNADLSTDLFSSGRTSEMDRQSTCDSEVPRETSSRSVPDVTQVSNSQGETADHQAYLANLLLMMEQSYMCKFCPRTFRNEESRTRHNDKVHAGEGRHSCKFCEKQFVTERHRDDHQRIHTVQPLSLKQDALVQSVNREYACSLCYKSFRSSGVRERHMRWHADNNRECKDCGKNFKSRRNLQRHGKSCPAIDKRVPARKAHHCCNSCGKVFKTEKKLARHNKIHVGEGLFSCEYCGKKFPSGVTRSRHHLIHTGERPYKCSICEKTFVAYSKLQRHETVHSEKGNYRCSVCDKSFETLASKKKHKAFHIGERLWQCDYCKNNFVRKEELRHHLRTCEEQSRKKLP